MAGKSLTKEILKGALLVGAIVVAASSPYFAFYASKKLWRALDKTSPGKRNKKKEPDKNDLQFKNAFYYLKSKGYLNIRQKNGQIYISLTAKGKKRAGKYQIDDLKIEKQKRWDGKYRIVFFDIPQIARPKRDALRGKLKTLGFYRLQHSVWVCPFECEKEIDLLRGFFGLTSRELILIEGKIKEDKPIREFFKI